MTLDVAIDAARHITSEVGVELTDPDVVLLSQAAALPLDSGQQTRIDEIANAIFRGFFHCGARGHTFADPEGIPVRFGATLESNYPEASPTFLRFAYSYWTFKLLVTDPELRSTGTVIMEILAEFEDRILRTVFFPTYGPAVFPPNQREQAQRRLILQTGAPLDINDFMRGNPVLIRDRQRTRSGGCGLFLLVVAIGVAMSALAAVHLGPTKEHDTRWFGATSSVAGQGRPTSAAADAAQYRGKLLTNCGPGDRRSTQ